MTKINYADIKVLVVDDEPFSRRVIERVLGAIGIASVFTAEDGAGALKLLEERTFPLDLIISDIEMPNLSGYELVRRLRYGVVPGLKDIPVIMLTGKDTERNVRSARIHKISAFLVKPPDAARLQAEIDRVFGVNT